MINEIVLKLPIPPSHNAIYKSFTRNGKIIRAHSKELSAWLNQLKGYELKCANQLKQLNTLIGIPLQITCTFFFHKTRIYCQSKAKLGEIKKLDVSNYLKATHDWISNHSKVDDKQFFTVIAHKKAIELNEEEHVHIYIRQF